MLKRKALLLTTALLLSTPALADTLTIAYQIDGGPLNTITSPTFAGQDGFAAVDGPWTFSAFAPTGGPTQGFELDAISRSNSTLNVWETVQGKTAPYTEASIQQWIRTRS